MKKEPTSSSSESETEETRQVWRFKKLWTKALDSDMSNPNMTCEHLMRKIVALCGMHGNFLSDLETRLICFKPEKTRATTDERGRRFEIFGTFFKPGMKRFVGKRWKLVAENLMFSCLLPMMCTKFEDGLPYEHVYFVLDGNVDRSSRQIKLDQDYQKTVVIAVNSGPIAKSETESVVHSVLSSDLKLSWSNSAKYRELNVEPLTLGITGKINLQQELMEESRSNRSRKRRILKTSEPARAQAALKEEFQALNEDEVHATTKKRKPRKKSQKLRKNAEEQQSANPAIEKWLMNRRKRARNPSIWYFAYSNALKSLRKHQLPVSCGKQLKGLKFFGKALCRKIGKTFDCRDCQPCKQARQQL